MVGSKSIQTGRDASCLLLSLLLLFIYFSTLPSLLLQFKLKVLCMYNELINTNIIRRATYCCWRVWSLSSPSHACETMTAFGNTIYMAKHSCVTALMSVCALH